MPYRRFLLGLMLLVLPGLACVKPETVTVAPNNSLPLPIPQANNTPHTNSTPEPKVKGTLTGRVLGEEGKPIVGASVWVIASYNGRRAYHETFTAKTNADGSYHVEGLPGVKKHSSWSDDGIAMAAYAVVTNRPPANIQFRAITDATVAPDLIIADRGSSLTVRVLNENEKPVTGAIVEVSTDEDGVPRDFYVGNVNRENSRSLRSALRPRVTTNAEGIARFNALLPDRYIVRATWISADRQKAPVSNDHDPFLEMFRRSEGAFGGKIAQCYGVPVGPGTETSYTLRLQTVRSKFIVRYKLPDGTIYKGESASIGTPPAARAEQPNNEGGIGTGTSEMRTDWDFSLGLYSGLRRITAKMKPDPPYDYVLKEPFLWSKTVIAHSPFWQRDNPLIIPVRRVEAGSLRVRLLDENNQPVSGVMIRSGSHLSNSEKLLEVKSDPQGYAVFEGLSSGEIALTVTALPLLSATVKNDATTFPGDAELQKRRVWRLQYFKIERGKRTEGTLIADRAGFIRGKIAGAPEGYLTYNGQAEREIGSRQFYDRRTGEYFIGPVPVGNSRLSFRGEKGGYETTLNVPNGVMRYDFATEPRLAYSPNQEKERRDRLNNMEGIVYLPDGKTPAVNASVWVTDERNLYPTVGFVTDANGRMRPSHLADSGVPVDPYGDGSTPEPSGGPKERVICAFLPGSHGMLIQPFASGLESNKIRLVLPPAIRVQGKVTLDGRSLPTIPGFVRVRAVPVEQGRLTSLLTVEVTVQSDGSFTLAGLTPGKYRVQAALENIYLSPEQIITVPASALGDLSAIALRLPRPGKAVVLSVGVKYADAPATLVEKLPDGPLATQTYARFYPVDGAGDLRIEGLPAGKWRLRLPDGKTVSVRIAPATFSEAAP